LTDNAIGAGESPRCPGAAVSRRAIDPAAKRIGGLAADGFSIAELDDAGCSLSSAPIPPRRN